MATGPVLLDAHAHFYERYDVAGLLDAAWDNFRRGALGAGLPAETPGFLILAGTARSGFPFRDDGCRAALGARGWVIRDAAEPRSHVVERRGATLILVEGRQIRTAEGLEIIVAGHRAELEDGRPFEETVRRAAREPALTMIPWGFGKWSLGRGRLVTAALGSGDLQPVILSDSAQRPRWSVTPRPLRAAEKAGRTVLAGTDPLPLPGEWRRAGSYGSVVAAVDLDPERPLAALRAALLSAGPARRFGRRIGLLRFLRAQLAVRRLADSGH